MCKLPHHPEQTAVCRVRVHVNHSCCCRSRNRHNAIIVVTGLVACAQYQYTQRHRSSILSVLSLPAPGMGYVLLLRGSGTPWLGLSSPAAVAAGRGIPALVGQHNPGKEGRASRRVWSDNDDRIGTGPSYYTTLQCPVQSNQPPKLSMPAHIDLIFLHGMTEASSSAPWPTHSRRASRPQRSRSSAKWNW